MKKSRKYVLAEGVDDSRCFCCNKNKNRVRDTPKNSHHPVMHANSHFERHHFPRSHIAGGKTYVPLCGMCHDIVDRYNLENWQESLLTDVTDELIKHWDILELMCGFTAMLKQEDGEANDDVYDTAIDKVLNLTEEEAWEIIETCEGAAMRLLALKVISMCFNEQIESVV
jgi:hypothetical protein